VSLFVTALVNGELDLGGHVSIKKSLFVVVGVFFIRFDVLGGALF
jgi:hypothetical protein